MKAVCNYICRAMFRWSFTSRSFWLVLLVLHGYALVGLARHIPADWWNSVDVIRAVALLLSVGFIGLKLVGSPWVHTRNDRTGLIVSWLLVALLHTHVLHRNVGVDVAMEPGATLVLVTSAAALVRRELLVTLRAALRLVTQVAIALLDVATIHPPLFHRFRVIADDGSLLPNLLQRTPFGLRAPPLS